MQKLLIDTDVIVDYLRTQSGTIIEIVKLQEADKAEIYISTVTILELVSGKTGDKDIEKIKQLLETFISVPLDQRLAEFSGRQRRNLSNTLSLSDLIIGSTAVWLKAKLVTRNMKHFDQIPGLKFY